MFKGGKYMFKKIEINQNYSIDENGNVRNDKRGTLISPWISKQGKGYYCVSLYIKKKKQGNFGIHKLLAQAFIPNPNNYKEVNHIDGNTKNNKLSNLEWCSHKMNIRHATQIIKVFDNYNKYTTSLRKKVAQIDMKTNEIVAIYVSVREAERQTGISSSYIVNCANKKQKYAKGYYWQYL